MTTETRRITDEAQIRKLIDDRARAMHDKDLNGLIFHYAPDVVEFDAVNPLQYRGLDGPRKRSEQWFNSYGGPIGYEVRDLSIAAGDEVAFCHFLYRITGTMTNGSKVDMWLRATLGLRKIDGKWLVTHEHSSVPFEMETGKAALTLKP
jgi:uncharacterized protein (TIGR02246 family)